MPKNPENIQEFEFTSFWVENKTMFLEGKKGTISHSKISGSVIQDEYGTYISSVGGLRTQMKQIKDSILMETDLQQQKKSEMSLRYRSCMNEIENRHFQFIYDHPNYYITSAELVFYITFMPDRLNRKKVVKFYDNLDTKTKANVYGNQIKRYVDAYLANKDLSIGDEPHWFSLPDSLGNEISLESLKGKVILLDFWASGCGPCRKEHKNYFELYKRYKLKGLEIISVSQDQSRKRWLKAMQKDQMIWESVWDEKKMVSINMYKIASLPNNYLINREGQIIGQQLRGEQLAADLHEIFCSE
ncbi:MAG: peroxiredoxin [Parvicella sp.]|jgi:peroxiredoxin